MSFGSDGRAYLPGLADRGAVVVAAVDVRVRQPPPVRSAHAHVVGLHGHALGDVALVVDVLEVRAGHRVAVGVPGPAPAVERPALELGQVDRFSLVTRVAVRVAEVGRVRAVEPDRVVVGAADVHRAEAGREGLRPAALVKRERHRDAIGLSLLLQVGHVLVGRGALAGVLVLDLIGDDVPASRHLVRRDDRVDLREPLQRRRQVRLDIAAVAVLRRKHPRRDAARVGLRVDVRSRPRDHVQPGLLRHVEELIHVPDAAEVVAPRGRRTVVPVEVDRDRVVPVGPHLLQVIEPQTGRRRAPRVELPRGDEDPLAVDQHGVLVIGDRLRRAEQHMLRRRDGLGRNRVRGRGRARWAAS